MVNKVNGQKYYEYTNVSSQKRKSAESSEFHMDLDKEGVIYEKGQEKKETPKTAGQEEAADGARPRHAGVKVEISPKGRERAVQEKQQAALMEQIRNFAQTAVSFLKTLWDRVWNDTPKEAEFPEVLAEHIEETEEKKQEMEFIHPLAQRDRLAWSLYTQEEVRAIFKRGDAKEIEDFLSEHGERHLAKNSDLLTQYDRSGSIVGLDRSDRERILHGDRNEIGL